MNGSNLRAVRIISALGLSLSMWGLSLAMGGCVGYVRAPGVDVIVPEPELFIFGGYEGGGRYRDYGHRGFESRGGRR